MLSNILNTDLLTIGITVAAIGLLGFVAFFSDPRSETNRAFLWVAITTIAYGGVNYFTYHVDSPTIVLWLVRVTIFFAVWNALSFLHFALVFPNDSFKYPKSYRFLIPWVALVSLFNLTPFVFSGIGPKGISQITSTPGAGVFGLTAAGLIIWTVVVLIRKTIKAGSEERKSFLLILWGAAMTFVLLIVCNTLLPIVFNNVRFIPLAPVWYFPFIAFTAYAIFKHHILNIKVVTTEALTFVLCIISLSDVIFSDNITLLIFRAAIFLFVLIFGIFLIQSVIKEIKQRERSEELAKEVEDKNGKLNEKTVELNKQLAEIEKMNKYMVDRELKMVELKKEIDDLKQKLITR